MAPANPGNGVAVEVDGLVKRFGDFTAVDGISFSVEPGELFGFLGPNGAGKTTTISILCTLLHPSGGRARVAGHDVAGDPTGVRSTIGLVFQEITLDDYLTGAENLRFHGVLYGLPRAEVKARMGPLLDMVGLTDWADQQTRFYSGGMKRRLEIARGLLHTPRVLFLDEPTIGLDPQTRVHIWDYVDELRARERTTMFLTTHYMDEAERCDRIAIIDQGRIVAIDSPSALKASVGADTVTLDDRRRRHGPQRDRAWVSASKGSWPRTGCACGSTTARRSCRGCSTTSPSACTRSTCAAPASTTCSSSTPDATCATPRPSARSR